MYYYFAHHNSTHSIQNNSLYLVVGLLALSLSISYVFSKVVNKINKDN